MFYSMCCLAQCLVSPAGSNQWLAAESSSSSSKLSVLGPSSFSVKMWTDREQLFKSTGWAMKKTYENNKPKMSLFFYTYKNETKNKATMCYHFIKINQNHRFHMLLQEFFIKLCPSVVSKNQAVAIQESQYMHLHIRLFSSAETWTRMGKQIKKVYNYVIISIWINYLSL